MRKVFTTSVCFLLILVTLISTVIVVSTTQVSAEENKSSNDRISTYISLAANGEVTDGDVSGMTEEQLRFLGLYLSNFYIPFGTEIGTSDSKTTETTKKDMVDTLKQKFAFSDKLATSIVDTVFGYTRSSLKQLSIYVSEEYQTGYEHMDYVRPNYYNFYRLMIGRTDDIIKYYIDGTDVDDDRKDNYDEIANNMFGKDYNDLKSDKSKICRFYYKLGVSQRFKYFYFAYKDEQGNIVPVLDGYLGNVVYEDSEDTYPAKYTPSQVAFLKCLEASNIELGYGTSYMDFSKDDGVSNSELKEISNSASKYDCTKMTMLGNKMAVDCFGDIIYMGGNHQMVVIPGCINPYSWQSVDKKGKDLTDSPAGSVFSIANSITINQLSVESGCRTNMFIDYYRDSLKDLYNKGSTDSTFFGRIESDLNSYDDFVKEWKNGNICKKVNNTKGIVSKINFDVLNKNLEEIRVDSSDKYGSGADVEYAIIPARLQRGSKEFLMEEGFLGMGESDARNFMMNAQDGFKKEHPTDKTYTFATSDTDVEDGEVSDSFFRKIMGYTIPAPRSKGPRGDVDYCYGINITSNIVINKNVVFIDNLGAYKNQDGSTPEFKTFNVASFIDKNGKTGGSSKDVSFGQFSFGNLYSNIKTGKLTVPTDATETALCTLYVTYCWAGLYDNKNKADTIGRLGYRINTKTLPDMKDNPLLLDGLSADSADKELESIRDWTYYLLHPTEGYSYFKTLITNKVNHLLLGWHNDMTGTNGTGVTTGTTKYRSNMGYVTMPDLSEIKWTDSLINLYNDCLPFLIVILIIIMLIAFISGILNLQHAALGVLLFSLFAILPVNVINATVEQSNRISQNIYGEKFTYWALVQQESYATAIDEAANSTGSSGTSTYDNYLRTLYNENQKVYTNQGNESIIVKWQAPKKMASLVLTESDAKSMSGLSNVGKDMLNGMLNRAYGGQSYVEDEESVYMYRSYLDLSNFSRYIYNGIKENTVKSIKRMDKISTSDWKVNMLNKSKNKMDISKVNKDYQDYITAGYCGGTDFGNSSDFSDQFYITTPMSSNIINKALKSYGKISKFKDSSDMINLNSDIFNFGIPMFNNSNVKFDVNTFASTGNIEDKNRKNDLKDYMSNFTDEDYTGLAAYSLYSENPYYYFSWKLYADGLDSGSSKSGSTGYKNLLLGQKDGGFFYNTEGNGGLKDFMNMKGLFTYIIPYLKQCNDVVKEWDNVYGIYIYDGIPTEEGHWDEVKNDPELKAKYWHNLNVTRLYGMYCPWVDIMYDCSYSDAENITIMGKQYTIEDPINPASYPKERPMIFSDSEMADYGLTEADLTEVEKIILKCNEQYQEKMYELLNYYNFSDVTLNSASAINCAFVFNSNFSENGIFEENHNIYPQSFDLANFSYDAFLRMILSNSTNESLVNVSTTSASSAVGESSGDFYENIVNNSSILTIIIMLILDVLSIYLIPAFKIFFLIALFIASIMIILVSAFKIEDNSKFLRKVLTQFFVPLILFFLTTIGFSLAISLFMGVGNDEVTQSNGLSISMGDPVITMLIMIALDLLLLFIYWKIIKSTLKDLKHHAKLVGNFGSAIGGAAAGFVAGAVAAGTSGVQNATGRVTSAYRRHRDHKINKSNNDALKEISSNTAQTGTGVENPRATERGSNGASDTHEDSNTSVRDVDKDKREANVNADKDTAQETEAKKDAINEKAMTGSEKLQESYDKQRRDRYKQAYGTIERDFGYAKNENGSIDTSKLSAKDKYKYQDRVNRVKEREAKAKAEERQKISLEKEKEAKKEE